MLDTLDVKTRTNKNNYKNRNSNGNKSNKNSLNKGNKVTQIYEKTVRLLTSSKNNRRVFQYLTYKMENGLTG